MPLLKVALADDHEIVRRGLRELIGGQPDMSLVGEATAGAEVIPLVASTRPDVMILDLMLPGLNGIELLPRVYEASPATRVLIFSMSANERSVTLALRAGAAGYALKEAPSVELLHAIDTIAKGGRFLSAPLSERAIDAYLKVVDGESDRLSLLTMREREVFALVVRGLSTARIAEELFISSRTVEKHRARAMHKLGLSSQTDAIRYAFKSDMLPEETLSNMAEPE